MTSERDLLKLLEPLHEDAFGWALACCAKEPDAARDVLQDAYVKVATARARFGGKSSLKTWWFGVIRFTAREQLRRRRRWREAIENLAIHFALAAIPEQLSTAAMDCDPEVLRDALRQLPHRQAEVLHLVFYQGLSLSEAAAIMGVSIGSARQHYQRGKQRLRGELAAAQPANATCHE